MDIRALAEREHAAEANKKDAEEAYRSAWWDTTMALGSIKDQKARVAACKVVAATTELTYSWIQSRARTGMTFRAARLTKVHALPPRMAVELVSKKVEITEQVVIDLEEAERTGMSLREFSAKVSGKAWSDTAAGASEDKITQMIESQPALVGRLVALHDKASRAHDSEVLRHHEREGITPPTRPEDWSSAEHVLTRLTLAVKELRRECTQPGDLTENARATIEWALAELTAIKEGRDFVGEIEAWLESSTA